MQTETQLLKLTLARRKGGELYPCKIQFGDNSPHNLFPADHKNLQKGKDGIMSLAHLCAEHALWEKRRRAGEPQPFTEPSPYSVTLWGANQDCPDWIKLIFNGEPLGKYLKNSGKPRSNNQLVKFSEAVTCDVLFDGSPASEQILQSFIDGPNSLKNAFIPPQLEIAHTDYHSKIVTVVRDDCRIYPIFIRNKDTINVSAITSNPEELSLFWIDSSNQILTLKSESAKPIKSFKCVRIPQADDTLCTISPDIEFDDKVGSEILIAIIRDPKRSPNLLSNITSILSEFSKIHPYQPFPRFYSHNYLLGFSQRTRMGAHAIEGDPNPALDFLTDALKSCSATFQYIIFPHKSR